jgi:nucleotide-binding universal stress UspA family protein
MNQIVAAVDGSKESLVAARLGLDLARKYGAALTLLQVAPPVVAPGEPPLNAMPGLDDALVGRAKSDLENTWRAIGQPEGVERLAVMGAPAEMIVATAQAKSADLIVVGSHGRGGMARVFLGSVAERVVRTAGRSVLVARAS